MIRRNSRGLYFICERLFARVLGNKISEITLDFDVELRCLLFTSVQMPGSFSGKLLDSPEAPVGISELSKLPPVLLYESSIAAVISSPLLTSSMGVGDTGADSGDQTERTASLFAEDGNPGL